MFCLNVISNLCSKFFGNYFIFIFHINNLDFWKIQIIYSFGRSEILNFFKFILWYDSSEGVAELRIIMQLEFFALTKGKIALMMVCSSVYMNCHVPRPQLSNQVFANGRNSADLGANNKFNLIPIR